MEEVDPRRGDRGAGRRSPRVHTIGAGLLAEGVGMDRAPQGPCLRTSASGLQPCRRVAHIPTSTTHCGKLVFCVETCPCFCTALSTRSLRRGRCWGPAGKPSVGRSGRRCPFSPRALGARAGAAECQEGGRPTSSPAASPSVQLAVLDNTGRESSWFGRWCLQPSPRSQQRPRVSDQRPFLVVGGEKEGALGAG